MSEDRFKSRAEKRRYEMNVKQNEPTDLVVQALEATQFGFNHSRCPACAGWDVGPNGETDRVHTKTCIVPKALTLAKLQSEAVRLFRKDIEEQDLSYEEVQRASEIFRAIEEAKK